MEMKDKISRHLLSLFVTTIWVVSRADAFIAEGGMFQGMDKSLMGLGCELKLCGVSVSTVGAELSEAVRGIWPRA
jgi:hypothetical protein